MFRAAVSTVLLTVILAVTASAAPRIRFGGDVVVGLGETCGRAVAVGGNVTVNGTVDGDAVAVGGSVRLGPGAKVKGDAVAVGGRVEREIGAAVMGNVKQIGLPGNHGLPMPPTPGFLPDLFSAVRVAATIGFWVLALVLVALFPGYFSRVSVMVRTRPGRAVLFAVLGTAALPPVMLLLVVTIIGIALVPALVLLLACLVAAGYIAAALTIADIVMTPALHRRPPAPVAALTGLVLLWLAGMVPGIGWVVRAAAGLTGYGAALAVLFDRNRTPAAENRVV